MTMEMARRERERLQGRERGIDESLVRERWAGGRVGEAQLHQRKTPERMAYDEIRRGRGRKGGVFLSSIDLPQWPIRSFFLEGTEIPLMPLI